MIPAVALSIGCSAVMLTTGILFLLFSRAEGARHLRWFATVCFTGLAFSVDNLFNTLPGVSDELLTPSVRIGAAIAAAHLATWVVYARARAKKPMRRLDYGKLCALAVAGLLCLLPGVVFTPSIVVHRVEWFESTYRSLRVTPLAGVVFFVFAASLASVVISLVREARGQAASMHVFGLVFFGLTVVVDLANAADLLRAPYLTELGMTSVIAGIGFEIAGRFVRDARALARLTSKLERDVHDRTEELVKARGALVDAERLAGMGRLAAAVGHEINNPLTYILLSLEEIRDRVEGQDETLARCAREALDGTDRIRRIVNDLRVLARHESDDACTADLHAVVTDALKLTRHQRPPKTHVEFDWHARLPIVIGSGPRLTQVISNCLVNAYHAVASGRPLTGHIEVRAQVHGDEVALEIFDNGVGIPPEHLSRVFEPFFSTKRDSGNGTGLGLAICKAIVSNSGGRMEIDSDGVTGTCVRITLRAAAELPADDSTPTRRPPEPSCGRVLVIDDDELVARSIARALRGFHVELALGGRQAIPMLENGAARFDAVVCDIIMPDFSGAEVFEHIRRAQPELMSRFLFLSGGALDDHARRLIEQSKITWLQKPVTAQAIREVIGALVQSQQH